MSTPDEVKLTWEVRVLLESNLSGESRRVPLVRNVPLQARKNAPRHSRRICKSRIPLRLILASDILGLGTLKKDAMFQYRIHNACHN